MAFLKRANGDTAGQIIELKPERVIIGRSPEHCHIVLDPNGVSRRHAEIYRKGDDFYLCDLNSRNMTRVNNAKVIPGIDHRLVTGRPRSIFATSSSCFTRSFPRRDCRRTPARS